MADLPADWDPKERERHPVSKVEGDKVFKSVQHMYGARLSSESILEALKQRKADPEWFARKVQRIIDGADDKMSLRALELLAKLLAHYEGAKIHQTSDLGIKETAQLEEAYAQLLGELKQEGTLDEPA